MMTTRLFSSSATNPEASIRGVTNRCTGSMPSTSIASISSRMVRDPRSAQIAVEPAPATIRTVTIGPTWVTAPNAAPAPDRSAAPTSRSRMFSVKLINTVNGTATSKVGANATRAMNQHCSKNSRQKNGRRKIHRTASADIANKPPTACIGPEKFRIEGKPADHRSAPLPRAIGRSFQDGDSRNCRRSADVVRQRNPCAIHLVGRLSSELREKLHALCHTRRPGRMALGLEPPAGVYRQRTADTCHFSLDKLVAPESLGKAQIFIADQFDSREEIVHFGDVDVGGCHACPGKNLLGCTGRRRKRCHVWLVLMRHRVEPEG